MKNFFVYQDIRTKHTIYT